MKKVIAIALPLILIIGIAAAMVSAAVPVTRNVNKGCDQPHDNLVYVLKGNALSVVPNGCPGEDQPDLQKNVRVRCDNGNLVYTLRSDFEGVIDIDVVPTGNPTCLPPI